MTSKRKTMLELVRARLDEREKAMPDSDQTVAGVEQYYRNAEIGDVAVVRETQHGFLQFTVTKIDGKNPKIGRVYVPNFGAFYMKHGKNCFHPKGQTTLVVPTASVLEWARQNPQGLLR